LLQSHYHPQPPLQPASLPAGPSLPLADHVSNPPHVGLPGSNFQGALPLYQPGGNLNSWVPNSTASGLAMPMYWQGFYGPPGVIPQLSQQPLLRPPPGLPIPPAMQQMQLPGSFISSPPMAHSGFSTSSMQDGHSAVVPNIATPSSLMSSSLPVSTLPLGNLSLQIGSLASETINSLLPNKVPVSASVSSSGMSALLEVPAPVPDNSRVPSVAVRSIGISGSVSLSSQQNAPIPRVAVTGSAISETLTPPLVTPGLLLPPSASASSVHLQTAQKDVEVVKVSPKQSPEPSAPLEPEADPPILPLPPNARMQKPNGSAYSIRGNHRGRGGRAVYTTSRSVAKFTEDFDFTAMNEKFNKDEVWGHLGKDNKSQSKDKEAYKSDEEEEQDEVDSNLSKPVYNKDDFFDSLSCNALDNNPNRVRQRYSEQMKLDTE
ncbi:hypothetical protein M569_17235, partial [Genlisea aurea]